MMAKYLGLLNLGNVTNSLRGKEISCPRRLVTKFSSLKKRGARLLHSVKHKFDEEFAVEKVISGDHQTKVEDLPINRVKQCTCNESKSQSKWRSRINDIGSMTRSALGKKRRSVTISQPGIQNVEEQLETFAPQTEDATVIVEVFNFSSDNEQNPEIFSRISKDSRNQSRLSSAQTENAASIAEEFSSLSERNTESLSRVSRDSRNKSRLSSSQAENATAIVEEFNFLSEPKRSPERLSRVSKDSRKKSRLSSLRSDNAPAVVTQEFNSLSDPDRISERLSRVSKDGGILSERGIQEKDATTDTPEKQRSLDGERRSSIKSQRTNQPLAAESIERINEIDTDKNSLKVEEVKDGLIETMGLSQEGKELEEASIHLKETVQNVEVQPIVDSEAAFEKEQPLQVEVVHITRKDFDGMKRDKDGRRIVRVDHKNLPPDAEYLSASLATQNDPHEEWRGVPAQVIDEIRRVTKPKRPHECSRACPCKFSQELIDIYHEAKLLTKTANKIGEGRNHCKFLMTSSEVDFFKSDTKMCNVMIGETQSRRAEMRELMDMWQEANEKLAVRKKEIFAIVESIDRTSNRMDEVEHLLKDWLPEGRMEKLRKAQRAIEKEDQARMEMLEDEERTFCKKEIEQIVQRREAWQADEEMREEQRKSQRQKDSLALQNATNLMQKYIDERKSLLTRY